MIKTNKRIEIVSSTRPGLSSMSPVSRESARAMLAKQYAHVDITMIDSLADLDALVVRNPDVVLLGMKSLPTGTPNERIWLSEYLENAGISHTGSGRYAQELEQNKADAKQRVILHGLDTSRHCIVAKDAAGEVANMPLSFPVFIKPLSQGGGSGIDEFSVAHDHAQAYAKVRSIAADYDSDSLVEEYLPGREFSVAVLYDEATENYDVMPLELVAKPDRNGVRMLSQQVKSSNEEQVLALTDPKLRRAVCDLALGVFHALGARDYGRIDIRLDAHGVPHFLEANLIPSLIQDYGSFPKACMLNRNISYERMLLTIVQLGMERATSQTTALVPVMFPA